MRNQKEKTKTLVKTSEEAVRKQYELHGVRNFYEQEGSEYRNPHEKAVRSILRTCISRWSLKLHNVLDLACGSGEATLELENLGCREIEGVDPFTGDAYYQRTGKKARPLSFEEIEAGALLEEQYDLIVCSYALHLVEKSRLPGLMVQLAFITPQMIVLTPHKKPEIKQEWGWDLQDEFVAYRVRARLYQSDKYVLW